MKPVILVENFFSDVQFPNHIVTADEEAADFPATRVGRGSRLSSNRWQPTTSNVEHWIRVECDQLRFADMLALDREHNLTGKQVILEGSNDAFVTSTEIFDVTIPEVPGGTLTGSLGAHTEESAWLIKFSGDAFNYWRLRIPAMGTDLVPEIGGLQLGLSWELAQAPELPVNEDEHDLRFKERELDTLWMAVTAVHTRREVNLDFKLQDSAEYEKVRLNILGHYRRRRPAWIVYDNELAERSIYAVPRPGKMGFGRVPDWPRRTGKILGIEHEPKLGGY